jgi:hypothetical protein
MLARELEPNRELFLNHLSFILHGALMGAGSLWPQISKFLPSDRLSARPDTNIRTNKQISFATYMFSSLGTLAHQMGSQLSFALSSKIVPS